ncbi:MAG: hypothetical protein HY908_06540 [Myxococcales bacterium]|nr:hypothetical protein [Myxococcales bacterium]
MPRAREPRAGDLRLLARLRSPADIQRLLDATPYSTDPIYRAPQRVLRDRRAHCVDGALLAALALRRLGHPPLVVDLRAERDDDHVIAVYRVRRHWGAVAKSNVVALRYREPVYRSLRELVMSYFDWYFNTDGERALRSYSVPLDLARFDALDWPRQDAAADPIIAALDRARHYSLLTPAMLKALGPVDERTYRAGLLGADPAGLYAADRLKIELG